MKSRKKTKSTSPAVPRLLRRPMAATATAAVLALNVALWIGAAVLNRMEASLAKSYTFTGDGIEKHSSADYFGAVCAAAAAVSAALCAVIIIGNILRHKQGGEGIVLKSIAASVLLAGSVVSCICAMYAAVGEQPKSTSCFFFTDSNAHLVIAEEQYSDLILMNLYSVDTETNEAALLAQTELNALSENEDRYSISWLSEDTLLISFADGQGYRSLQVPTTAK